MSFPYNCCLEFYIYRCLRNSLCHTKRPYININCHRNQLMWTLLTTLRYSKECLFKQLSQTTTYTIYTAYKRHYMRSTSVNSANVTGLVKTIRAISEQNNNNLSQCMRFPTMCYVQPAKPQISLSVRSV